MVSVAIVEDHQLLSESLRATLLAHGYSVVLPPPTDLGSVAAELRLSRPTVAILDLDLGPAGTGEDLLPVVSEVGARGLIVSGGSDEAVVGRCLLAGAWGWVSKSAPLDDLVDAIERTAAGEAVLTAQERERLEQAWRQRRQELESTMAPFERLSRREGEVLDRLRAGQTVERIAAAAFVSEATVRSHVRAILTKLEVNSQLEAVAKAVRAGWPGPTRDG